MCIGQAVGGKACVKSPVASLCFVCSSVRKRVRVTMSYLTFSSITGGDAIGFDMARRRSEDFIYSDRGKGEGNERGIIE